MNLECCKTLMVLNEDESKNCNGGMSVFTVIKVKLPPIVYPLPLPDDDHRL